MCLVAGQWADGPVLGQVQAVAGHDAADGALFLAQEGGQAAFEEAAVVGQGHMHIGPLFKEGRDQRCRNVGQAAGLRGQVAGVTAHAIGQIGNLRGNHEDAGVFQWGGH